MHTAETEFVSAVQTALDRFVDRLDLRVPNRSPSATTDRSTPTVSSDRRRPGDTTWLSVREAARYLALPSPKAIYQAIRRGQIPVHRFGRRLRFLRAELDTFLARR